MELLQTILREVKSGKRSFTPEADTKESLADFQPIAKRLQSAHAQGYITKVSVKEGHGLETHGSVLGALVSGGLTFEGEQFLQQLQTPESKENFPPILQLKPGIWGMSIDLNALWQRIKKK